MLGKFIYYYIINIDDVVSDFRNIFGSIKKELFKGVFFVVVVFVVWYDFVCMYIG